MHSNEGQIDQPRSFVLRLFLCSWCWQKRKRGRKTKRGGGEIGTCIRCQAVNYARTCLCLWLIPFMIIISSTAGGRRKRVCNAISKSQTTTPRPRIAGQKKPRRPTTRGALEWSYIMMIERTAPGQLRLSWEIHRLININSLQMELRITARSG